MHVADFVGEQEKLKVSAIQMTGLLDLASSWEVKGFVSRKHNFKF
jgi:hypothetical protein